MIITTSDHVEGKTVVKTVGLVKGNTIRARHVGRDIKAGLKSLVGGEITDYTKMMSDAREQAIQRMVEDAKEKGANAIVSMRLATSMIMQNAAEVLAYGTGVVLE
ncbi:MAG: YbjQ family protein [Dehalococcoidia bacterium]|nr:MAG: YbjQ family protein [Dehalococcoidia bacterium]